MTLTFRYKRVKRQNGTEVKTPSIPITLSTGGAKYDFVALLDSGADVSALPKAVPELLGVNLYGIREEASGIGGTVQTVQSKLHLEVGRAHERYYLSIPIKVILSDDEFPILLGRAGFFDQFIITFNQQESRVLLKRVAGTQIIT